MFVSHALLLAVAALAPILGTAIAASAASINTTIINSTSVNALFFLVILPYLSKNQNIINLLPKPQLLIDTINKLLLFFLVPINAFYPRTLGVFPAAIKNSWIW
jgi:hypothetical protein